MDIETRTAAIHYSYTGSLAASIQSPFYGGFTRGIFSMLQSFGAKFVIAPRFVLGCGGTLLVFGAQAIHYWWYRRREGGRSTLIEISNEH